MKRVVSVSLGSSSRDWKAELTPLGVELKVERCSVGADYRRYAEMLIQLDHEPDVAAIGLGGINRYLFVGEHLYPLRKAEEMVSAVHHKPVTDGIGLKLMVCIVDRWGMAAALREQGAEMVCGDVMFALGLPVPLRSWQAAQSIARSLLPVLTRHVPFEWLYPTGESKPHPKYRRWYEWADVLAGDYKFIAKHMPEEPGSLAGKTVLTNTTTPADLEALRKRGVATLITTTPSLGGRSFGTNVIEGVAVALAGKPPAEMTFDDYMTAFHRLGWDQPRVEQLQ
jgi:hypothetical protein